MIAQEAALKGAASCNCADVKIGDSALSPIAASRNRTPHRREPALILDVDDPMLRDTVYGRRRRGREWNGMEPCFGRVGLEAELRRKGTVRKVRRARLSKEVGRMCGRRLLRRK